MSDLVWKQHRWPDGIGIGHYTFIPCGEDCTYPGVITTYHDAPPPPPWEEE